MEMAFLGGDVGFVVRVQEDEKLWRPVGGFVFSNIIKRSLSYRTDVKTMLRAKGKVLRASNSLKVMNRFSIYSIIAVLSDDPKSKAFQNNIYNTAIPKHQPTIFLIGSSF